MTSLTQKTQEDNGCINDNGILKLENVIYFSPISIQPI